MRTPNASRILFTTVLLDLIGFGMVLPLLPSYAARYTPSPTIIGILVATDSALSFLTAPWWGRASDRIGRRPILLIGLAGSAAAYLAFGLAGSLAALFLSRMISGATGGTVNVAQAYLADITPPERRSHAMGLIGAAFGLGFTIGPALGGIASLWGDHGPGLLAFAITGVNLVLAWLRLPETEVRRRPNYRPLPLEWRQLASPFGVMLCTTLAFTAIYVAFPLFCQQVLGYDRRRVSALFVVIGVITIIVQGRLVGRLAPRFGERALMIVGSLTLAAGFGAIPLSALPTAAGGRAAAIVAAVALLTTGFCLVGPSLAGLVSRSTDAASQGRALGALQSVGAMARIVGPPVAGVLAQLAGPATPFYGAAVAALTGGAISVAARRHLTSGNRSVSEAA